MRILLVNHLLDAVSGGGTAERTFQLGRCIGASGVDCTILTLDIGITAERRAALGRTRLVAVPCINRRFFVPRLPFDDLLRLIDEVDVVQLSGHWTWLNAMVFRACRRLGKPYLFCPAGALRPFGRSLWLKRFYDAVVGRRIVQGAARCVAITEEEQDDFHRRGVEAGRVVVVPNGIDPGQYVIDQPAEALDEFRRFSGTGTAPFVLFLGRLNEIKGPDLLLEAFALVRKRFAGHHLVFAGPDGGMGKLLTDRAAALGLGERVHLTGYVGGTTKAAALQAASLLAIPSRQEAMSIVVLEAGACQCPVLFTDRCGLADLARAGAGTMVAAEIRAIAEGLAGVLGDETVRKARAARLSEIVGRDYLWSVQAARFTALCRDVA